MSTNLYAILEVESTASTEELKKSYRRLARQYHPDTNPGDAAAEAKFKEVSQAYEILSDPDRRAHYDRFGADVGAGGPGGFDGSVQDLFDMFFQGFGGGFGGAQRGGPPAGSDAEVVLDITLEEAAFGARRDVTVTLPVRCDTCAGSGAAEGSSPTKCSACQGSGQVRAIRNSILGQMVTVVGCSQCQGVGTTVDTPCSDCRGEGRRVDEKTLTIEIPAGVENGSTMRLADRGPAGPRGGRAGTLYVALRVSGDPRFERIGDDLHHTVTISFVQAVFGATLQIPTLEGDEEVAVPSGTTHGSVLRLRGKGVTHLRGRGRGDILVHIEIEVPTHLDAESEEHLRAFAASRGEDVPEASHGLFGRKKGSRK